MFRTAFIILALALVLPARSSAAGNQQEPRYAPQNGAAGNLHKEPMGLSAEASAKAEASATEGKLHKEPIRAEGEEGNLHKDQHAQNSPVQLGVISCDIPGPKPRPILVPAGKNPLDFCPASAITYHLAPGVIYSVPWAPAGSPLPLQHAGGGH